MSSKRSFPPVTDVHTRILILGSLPGDVSLAHQQYYAHPQNKFWQLISDLIHTDMVALPYPQRLQTLLQHGIGLWDVVAQASRSGSLDSNIRDLSHNDLSGLLAQLPQLHTIAFNGGTAARIGMKALGPDGERYRLLPLPSSSPAHASLRYAEKLARWQLLTAIAD